MEEAKTPVYIRFANRADFETFYYKPHNNCVVTKKGKMFSLEQLSSSDIREELKYALDNFLMIHLYDDNDSEVIVNTNYIEIYKF